LDGEDQRHNELHRSDQPLNPQCEHFINYNNG
jgi:hypothetical protein